MGALNFYCQCDEFDKWAKRHIYSACVLTVLLWGSENWALSDTLMKRLHVFHHRSIQKILKINTTQVQEQKITNEIVREKIGNIPLIDSLIRIRKLKFASHVVRAGKLPHTVLSAWMEGTRPRGRPRCTI